MKAAKITAKIRDAVPVEFYEDGNERAVYKNIEIPDSLKALEIKDFRFITPEDGKISFRLYFAPYTLPEIMPEPKPPVTREQRRAAKAAKAQQPGADAWSEAANEYNAPENPGEPSDDIAAYLPAPGEDYTITTPEGAVIAEIHHGEVTDEAPAEEPDEDEDAPEADEPAAIRFDVPGKKRGALARAIADYTGDAAEYLNPPSYAYQIGTLGLERDGSLIGELPDGLLEALAEQGFIPAVQKSAPKIQQKGSKTSTIHNRHSPAGGARGRTPPGSPAAHPTFCVYPYLSQVYPLTTAGFFRAPKLDFWLDKHIQTAPQVETLIQAALSTLDTDIFVVVDPLPPANTANPNKIYLAPAPGGSGDNVMEEWVAVNGAWEKLGSVDISLEGYFNESNLVPITNGEIDAMIASLSP